VASTPQASQQAQTADTTAEVSGSTAAEAGTEPEPLQTPPERTEAFDALVEDLRRRFFFGSDSLYPVRENLIYRRLGVAPMSPGAMLLTGLMGSGIKLSVALLATALFGEWAGIPWGRWAAVLVGYGAMEALNSWSSPPLGVAPPPRFRQ